MINIYFLTYQQIFLPC